MLEGAGQTAERRILSRPFPVEWAGWESTTQYLHACGWQIAAQYEWGEDMYRFAFHNEHYNLQGYADWMHISRGTAFDVYYNSDKQLPPIRIRGVAKALQVYQQTNMGLEMTPWHLVDGRPQLNYEPIQRMEQLSVFARLQPKEILIPQADMSVVEQLEAIIKAQEPKQHELRQLILAQPRGVRQIATLAEVA